MTTLSPQGGGDVQAARRAFAAGDLRGSERILRVVLDNEPRNGEARALLAGLALAANYVEVAFQLASEALRDAPGDFDALLALGRAAYRRGDLIDATRHLTQAVSMQPEVPMLRLELGLALESVGQCHRALVQFARAYRGDRNLSEAHYRLACVLGEVLRADPAIAADVVESPADMPPPAAARFPKVSVVICSIRDERFARVRRNYESLLQGLPHEIIRIPDAPSLCEGYNRGVSLASGEIVVFSHDDIEVLTPTFASRLWSHLQQFDIVGVAGADRVVGHSWGAAGWPHGQGHVAHFDGDGSGYELALYRVASRAARDIQVLDGLFFATRRSVFERVRFDELLFDGFHAYDLDFSYSAYKAGLRLGVCNDILVVHDSRGNFGERYKHYLARFEAKHRATLSPMKPATLRVPMPRFDTKAELLDFSRVFLHLVEQPDAERILQRLESGAPRHNGLHPLGAQLRQASGGAVREPRLEVQRWQKLVSHAPRTLLHVGCGNGTLAARLAAHFGACTAFGVEPQAQAASRARQHLHAVWQGPLESFTAGDLKLRAGSVDLMLLDDVLARTPNPWLLLQGLRDMLSEDAMVLIRMHNARNLVHMAEVADGNWAYKAKGLPQLDHVRVYTLQSMRVLLSQAGLKVTGVQPTMDPRLAEEYEQGRHAAGGVSARLSRLVVDSLAAADFQELCALEFHLAAQPADGAT